MVVPESRPAAGRSGERVMKELIVSTWPHLKKPLLTAREVGGNHHEIIARFESEAAVRVFMHLVKNGVAKAEVE